MANILIVYGSSYGQTALISRNLAAHMRTLGADVMVQDVRTAPPDLDPSRFDAVVLGGRIHGGKHPRKLVKFARRHATALAALPTAFYSVSLVLARKDGTGAKEAEAMVQRFLEETALRPALTALFAGALKYTKYNFFLRWMMRRIARAEGGATDTSRDYEYTDWNDVRRFGASVVSLLQPRPAADLGAQQPTA